MKKFVLLGVSWLALAAGDSSQAVAQWLPGVIGGAINAVTRPAYRYGYYGPGYYNYYGRRPGYYYGYGYGRRYPPGYNYAYPQAYYGNQPPAANVVPQPAPNPTPAAVAVKIVNPSSNTNTLNYILNGKSYTIQPGQSQPLAAGQTWVVEFDRGGTFGNGRYTLSGGTYTFTPTAQGWELYRKTP